MATFACNKRNFGRELRTADTRLKSPQHEQSDRSLYTADNTCLSVVVRNSDPRHRWFWLHGTWLRENHARAGKLYGNSACAGNARTWLVGLGDNSRRTVRRPGCIPGCLHTDRQHTDGNRAVRGDLYGPPKTDLLYFTGLLALVLGGSGPLAFDNIILRRSSKATKTKSVLGGCMMALLAVASGAAYAQMKTTEIAAAENAGRVDDAEGNLRVPADYRTAYQFLGSWAVAADQGQGSKEIHVVYASPGTIAAYRKDGWFPDGSVLVKEVSEATTGAMTTGDVSHANILKGWFVMMKDSKIAILTTSCGATVGVGRGSMPPRLQKPHRQITKWIAKPAMYRRELPIGFMSKVIPR